MESGAKAWYVTDKSRREMTEADKTVLEKGAVVDVSDVGKYPLASRRAKLLDDLDAATGGTFPVRIDACRPLRVLPRVREDGTLDSVTILNLSIGDTDAFAVRVRRPASRDGVSLSAKGEARPFHVAPGATDDEGLVEIPNIPGWRIMTLFFADS